MKPPATSAAFPPLDRSAPPPPGRRREFRFPSFTSTRLDNGLRLLLAPMPEVPLVSGVLLLPAGGQHAPEDLPGLPALHGELLDEGTAGRSAMDIARAVEQIGGSLDTQANWNMATVEMEVLAGHLDIGLELVADLALRPTFPEAEVERLKEEQVTELMRRRSRPVSLAEEAFIRLVYAGTVYGHPLLGAPEALERVDRDAVHAFYRRRVVPGGAAVVAAGDFDPDALASRLGELFGGWRPGETETWPDIHPVPLERTRVVLVDRPKAAQTQLLVGQSCLPRKHPDYHALMMLNILFGGKFTSRVNLNLRERHGYTYGANSFLVRRRGPGPFFVRTAVANEVAGSAVDEILGELRRLQQDEVEQEELRDSQEYVLGMFPQTVQTAADVAGRLENLVVFDLPDDHFDHFPAVLGEVTTADVLDVARRHLRPEAMAVVAVGPADELRPQLERQGPVDVVTPP